MSINTDGLGPDENTAPPIQPQEAPLAPKFANAGPVFQLATFWQRVGGRLIDGLIALGIVAVIGFIFLILWAIIGTSSGVNDVLLAIMVFLMFIGAIGFQVYNLYLQGKTGQTVGKRFVGIMLVRESDAEVSMGLSYQRWGLEVAMSTVSNFTGGLLSPLIIVVYLWPLWDPKRQTLIDKLVHCVVIVKPNT